jgi:hypothetical protein
MHKGQSIQISLQIFEVVFKVYKKAKKLRSFNKLALKQPKKSKN